MEFCICVSTETLLQVVKIYTIVKKNFKKLLFQTVVLHQSECTYSDEGLQSEMSVF